MNGDARGWRIALVPDTLINPRIPARAALPGMLSVLETTGSLNAVGALELAGALTSPPPPPQPRSSSAVRAALNTISIFIF